MGGGRLSTGLSILRLKKSSKRKRIDKKYGYLEKETLEAKLGIPERRARRVGWKDGLTRRARG
jgi:hypothetical protein